MAHMATQILKTGMQVKIIHSQTDSSLVGMYGIVDKYLPNYDAYLVNVKGHVVMINVDDIDLDPQMRLNV